MNNYIITKQKAEADSNGITFCLFHCMKGEISFMRKKLTRFTSVFLAMLLFMSAIMPSGNMRVQAASSLKAALKEESGKGIPADEGWSLYNALKRVPATFSFLLYTL